MRKGAFLATSHAEGFFLGTGIALQNKKFFYVQSQLHLRFIFACLPDFYLFRLADFKAMASRHRTETFKLTAF